MDRRLLSDRFPRSSTYSPDWLTAAVSGGANPLWLTEWLTAAMALEPGMRVLDLGCGRAASSVFLRRELGVEVWATDLWFSPSFVYYGTDDLYLGDIARLLRPGGVIGIAGAGLEHEIDGYVRAVARRTAAPIDPPITSVATKYTAAPLVRGTTVRE